MDVLYFLQQHTRFIRNFRSVAVAPFEEIQQKISEKVAPFVPPYSEDGEPAFIEEWSEAEQSKQIIGRTCISLLSNTFKLYLNTWVDQLQLQDQGSKAKKRETPLERFQRLLDRNDIKVDWSRCPADTSIVEQLTLARNRDQHPEMIGTLTIQHDQSTLEKYPRPLFVNPKELEWLIPADDDWDGSFLMNPSLHINDQTLEEAISTVEKIAAWIEPQLNKIRYQKTRRVKTSC